MGSVRTIAAVLLFATACAPTRPGGILAVDSALLPAWNRAASAPAPWAGTTVGEWATTTAAFEMRVRDISDDYAAQYKDGKIWVHPNSLSMHVDEIAAFLVHELRHADGYRHDCSGNRDKEFGVGPWSVHIMMLEYFGITGSAEFLRKEMICSRW